MKDGVKEKLALIRILPMLTRSGSPSMSHRFPRAPFARRG